jgi:hypothetical protein
MPQRLQPFEDIRIATECHEVVLYAMRLLDNMVGAFMRGAIDHA